jgi:UDP-N-acetyl-D-glucosamine dehydrogenase
MLNSNLNDKINIDLFLEKNKNKKIIVVQGLGFVGAVMSLVCANSVTDEYAVIGIDLYNEKSIERINNINNGIFPINTSDKKVYEYYENCIKKGNFYATFDHYVFTKADIVIIDINLDVEKISDNNKNIIDFNVNLTGFKNAVETIGNNCKEDVLILVETTVPPGTCQNLVFPTITDCLKKRGLNTNRFLLGHSYERVMPGPGYIDSIQNFYRVYSGINIESANSVEYFLKTIIYTDKFPLTRLQNTNATEIAKVLENSYRALNIAFAVEWSRYAEEAGVNLYEIVDAIRLRPTHSNLMYPGIGVGGYCLTKDPLLASWGKINHFSSSEHLKNSISAVEINDKMPYYAFHTMVKLFKIKNLKNINILLLGISYRSNVGDTRFSPVENFYNKCIEDGANIFLHDPYISFWEEKGLIINSDINSIFIQNSLDIIIFSTAHDEYKNNEILINNIMSLNKVLIYDTVGVLNSNEIVYLQKKHIVKVLGRGDL